MHGHQHPQAVPGAQLLHDDILIQNPIWSPPLLRHLLAQIRSQLLRVLGILLIHQIDILRMVRLEELEEYMFLTVRFIIALEIDPSD